VTPGFDRADPGFLADPYPTWQRLRVRDPVHLTGNGTYLLTRHADVTRLLRDPRCGRSIPERLVRRVAGTGDTLAAFRSGLLNLEEEHHRRLRKLLLPPFAARAVAARRGRVGALVDQLLDRAGERFDLVDGLAGELPIRLVADLLGLPRADCPMLKRGIGALIDASTMFPTPAALAASDEANGFFRDYFRRLAGRPDGPGGGLLGQLAAAHRGGALTARELSANATLLLFAGHETTTNSLGNAVLALLEHPAQLAALRRDPALLPAAVDELLRFDSPVQTTIRWTRAPVELPTGRLAGRRFVEVALAAANRDPGAFDRPDQLRLDRRPNPHVAFGHGMHLCLGLHLARLVVEVGLERLLRRYPVIELAGAPVRVSSLWNRGLARLPLRVRPAGPGSRSARAA
jgi:unspecific monooxygenase